MQSTYNQWRINFATGQHLIFRVHHSIRFLGEVKVLSLLDRICAKVCHGRWLPALVFYCILSSIPWPSWSFWKLSNIFSINYFSVDISQSCFLLLPTKKLELCSEETYKGHFSEGQAFQTHTHVGCRLCLQRNPRTQLTQDPPERPAWLCKSSISIQPLVLSSGGVRLILWSHGYMIHRDCLSALSHRKPQVGCGGPGNVCGIFILMLQ